MLCGYRCLGGAMHLSQAREHERDLYTLLMKTEIHFVGI